MSLYLLDSDSIIDFLKGFPSSIAFIQNLIAQGHALATSDVVIAEIYSGLHLEDRQPGEDLISSLTYLPTSRDAARQAGDWRYAFARRGTALSLTDTLIAATAQEHGATLVTANTRDYPMSDVTVVALPRMQGRSPRHDQE